MLAALAVGCFVAATGLTGWLVWPTFRRSAARLAAGALAAAPVASAAATAADARQLAAARRGWLRVLDAATVIQVCKLADALKQIKRESKLSDAVWVRDIAPAIEQYVRYVQLLPASEAHHHAHVGGLAAHTIEVVYAAIVIRNGYLLPRGGAAEAVDGQRDHWTYAVIFAALLHDIGKLVTDLRVDIADRPDGPSRPWLPLAGDMSAAGAVEYRVRFAPKGERSYGAHRRVAQLLTPHVVPATALAFLAREPDVMRELEAVLAEDGASSVLAEIVRRADQRSAASNLQQGPRNQFESATAIPLIERLMGAVRRLLRQGALPLNRDGAAGWVADGAVWFVAKRLADAAREEIARADPDGADSVPGPSKNDRLFDTWQDYGVLVRNPDTDQAIWYVEVRGKGYAHEFAMLKFPLDKLFDGLEDYPPEFDGEIVVRPPRGRREAREGEEQTASERKDLHSDDASNLGRSASGSRKKPDIPPPKPPHSTAGSPGGKPPRHAQPQKEAQAATPADLDDEDDFLSEDDSASAAVSPVVPSNARRPAPPPIDGPVTPFASVPCDDGAGRGTDARVPSEAALRFMAWLQRGIADGSIPYNEAGAPIHFVQEGMALVSPRTFRDFATRFGDDGTGKGTGAASTSNDKLGTGIQRQVIKARWHVVGPGNANVLHYSVLGRGGKPVGKLAAVVIKHPERWINPVPPPNPNIVPFAEIVEGQANDGKS